MISVRRKLFAAGVSSLALVAGAVAPAVAAPAGPAVHACIKWTDHAGPGHAGRGHAKCAGMRVYVQTTAYCRDGSVSVSRFNWEYAKAECPYATDIDSVDYRTRR